MFREIFLIALFLPPSVLLCDTTLSWKDICLGNVPYVVNVLEGNNNTYFPITNGAALFDATQNCTIQFIPQKGYVIEMAVSGSVKGVIKADGAPDQQLDLGQSYNIFPSGQTVVFFIDTTNTPQQPLAIRYTANPIAPLFELPVAANSYQYFIFDQKKMGKNSQGLHCYAPDGYNLFFISNYGWLIGKMSRQQMYFDGSFNYLTTQADYVAKYLNKQLPYCPEIGQVIVFYDYYPDFDLQLVVCSFNKGIEILFNRYDSYSWPQADPVFFMSPDNIGQAIVFTRATGLNDIGTMDIQWTDTTARISLYEGCSQLAVMSDPIGGKLIYSGAAADNKTWETIYLPADVYTLFIYNGNLIVTLGTVPNTQTPPSLPTIASTAAPTSNPTQSSSTGNNPNTASTWTSSSPAVPITTSGASKIGRALLLFITFLISFL